jgi:protein-tyrosine phosphatase
MPASRPRIAAALALPALALFFFLTYGFANWVTSQRAEVGSLVFGWERHIPFLPWTIVPYWSTDLFYAAALFLCASLDELKTLVKRLIAVQVISVAGFLLFPLRFSFARSATGGFWGWWGWLFDLLGSFDQPFNQAPSLHLGITVILWAVYSRHLAGWRLRFVQGWFILMGLSTLTTYQHHFIDIPTGVWVGLLCLGLFPDNELAVPDEAVRNRQTALLGAAYSLGFAALAALAWRLGGLAWLLLWPAGSLLIVAGIYWSGRAGLFRKHGGTMVPAMRILLAPYVAGAWINSRLWTGRVRAQEIHDGVWLGRAPRPAEREALGIASLVDVSAELPVNPDGTAYRQVPILDLVVPTVKQLDAAVEAIEEVRPCPPTLVFCALGYSRSAMAVAAWLVARGHAASAEQAISMILKRRPGIALSPAHRSRLEEWSLRRS